MCQNLGLGAHPYFAAAKVVLSTCYLFSGHGYL